MDGLRASNVALKIKDKGERKNLNTDAISDPRRYAVPYVLNQACNESLQLRNDALISNNVTSEAEGHDENHHTSNAWLHDQDFGSAGRLPIT